MRRNNLDEANCPVARSLASVGDWWSLLILRDAILGKRRFGEFQKSLGLGKNILAARLRKLVACGILQLVPASDGSSYQEYVLTEKGRALRMVVGALRFWGTCWLFDTNSDAPRVLDRTTGEEIVGLGFRTKSGRIVAPSEVEYVTDSTLTSTVRDRSTS